MFQFVFTMTLNAPLDSWLINFPSLLKSQHGQLQGAIGTLTGNKNYKILLETMWCDVGDQRSAHPQNSAVSVRLETKHIPDSSASLRPGHAFAVSTGSST